ncbi:MAG: 50S ribosomal protein L4 [Gemmatimonadota bacterium]|nr:50S ribosomal protein L4 [Gemmatimonadota bacterium]
MVEANRYTASGPEEATVELPERWFGAEVNKNALYLAIRAEKTNSRAGTASTKTRAEKRGGGAKPWRQKGTGRARHGSIRSPIWTGGGVTHGPRPKKWREQVPRKVRRLAFRSALSQRAADGAVLVFELEPFEEPKTARLVRAIRRWELEEDAKVLLLVAEVDENLLLSGRNVPWLTVKKFADASALDVLRHDVVAVEDGSWETRRG